MLHLGHASPTPVQAQAWPAALAGLDLICRAPTGGGKTLAYLLPASAHVQAQRRLPKAAEGPAALVVVSSIVVTNPYDALTRPFVRSECWARFPKAHARLMTTLARSRAARAGAPIVLLSGDARWKWVHRAMPHPEAAGKARISLVLGCAASAF